MDSCWAVGGVGDLNLYEMYSYLGYRGNFVTVAGVMDIWSVVLRALPVPAGKGEQKEDERSQHHTAPTEVECQVI